MKNIDYTKYSLEDLEALEALAEGGEEPVDETIIPEKEPAFMDRFSKYKEPLKEFVGRPIARAAKSTAAAAGDIADVASSPFKAIMGGLTGHKMPSYGQKIREGADALTGGLTVPRNQFERNVDTATEAVASLPIGGPAAKITAGMSRFQKLGKSAQTALSAQRPTGKLMSGAAAAGATSQHLADNPYEVENPLLKSAADIGSSIGASTATQAALQGLNPKNIFKGGNWASKKIAGKIADLGEFDQKAVEDARLAGIELTPADALKSPNAKRQQNIMGRMPFVGGKIQKALDKTYQTALESMGQDKGELLTKEAGAELAQKGTKALDEKYQNFFKKEYGSIEKKIEKHRKTGQDRVSPQHALDFINKERNRLSSSQALADFDETEIGQFRNSIENYGKDFGGKVAFNDLVQLRQAADDATTTHGIHGIKTKGALKKLSERINQDLTSHLKDVDPDVYEDWKAVNKEYSQFKDKILPAINKVSSLSKEGKDIDSLMSIMPTKKGGKALTNVLNSLPEKEDKEALFNIVVRTAGMDNKGNFSMVRANNYLNNLTDITRNKLLHASGKTGTEIKKYKAVMRTIGNVWKKAEEENHSQSGSHLIQHGMGLSIMSSIASGNYLGAAKQIGGIALATAGTGSALKNQKLINEMYNAYELKNMTPQQFKKWSDKVSATDAQFKKVIQATVKGSLVSGVKQHALQPQEEGVPEEITAAPAEDSEELPIDYNSMSVEELEKLAAMAEEE